VFIQFYTIGRFRECGRYVCVAISDLAGVGKRRQHVRKCSDAYSTIILLHRKLASSLPHRGEVPGVVGEGFNLRGDRAGIIWSEDLTYFFVLDDFLLTGTAGR